MNDQDLKELTSSLIKEAFSYQKIASHKRHKWVGNEQHLYDIAVEYDKGIIRYFDTKENTFSTNLEIENEVQSLKKELLQQQNIKLKADSDYLAKFGNAFRPSIVTALRDGANLEVKDEVKDILEGLEKWVSYSNNLRKLLKEVWDEFHTYSYGNIKELANKCLKASNTFQNVDGSLTIKNESKELCSYKNNHYYTCYAVATGSFDGQNYCNEHLKSQMVAETNKDETLFSNTLKSLLQGAAWQQTPDLYSIKVLWNILKKLSVNKIGEVK